MKSCSKLIFLFLYFHIIFCFPVLIRCQETNISTKFTSVDELVDQIIKNQSISSDEFSSSLDQNSTNKSEPTKRGNLFDNFPGDFMNSHFRRNGGFIIHILLFLYFCLVLTLVIDSYFVPSLQFFSMTYNLSPNITGATFMVLGTSLPELFTSVINVFVGEASIGTGAIVVSSIFNVLAIPGICGLVLLSNVGQFPFISISSWPMRREIIFYSITIIVFILGIKDDSIDWLESLVFIFIYTVYMFCLYLWSHFEITQQNKQRKFLRQSKDRHWLKYTHYLQQSKINMQPSKKISGINLVSPINEQLYKNDIATNPILKYPLMPFRILFSITIPRSRKQYLIITYILSSMWIVAITYLLIWMVAIISETFHFTHSSSVMTMLALGNITKLISSVIVVKRLKLAEMAICHALGSNIFNTLICLGLPWFLKIFMLTVKEGSTLEKLQGYMIPLDDCLFEYVATSLTLLLITFILIFYLSDWKLTIKSSTSCIVFYVIFLTCLVVFDQYISIV